MELTVAQWWASFGETEVGVHIEFHGIVPSCAKLTLDGRALFGELEILSPICRTPVEPAGELKTLERAVRPYTAKLVPPVAPVPGAPGIGDQWPETRILYDYLLGYKFSLKDATEVSVRFPSLCCHLYESPYEAQLWGIFDANKRLVTFGDYYPSVKKLPPGDYELRLQVRHDQAQLLEKLRHLPAMLHLTLEKPLPLAFHWSRADALGAPPPNKPPSRVVMEQHARLALFVTAPALPEVAQPGDTLSGNYSLAKIAAEARGSQKRPSGFSVSLVVPPAEVKDEKKEEEEAAEDPASVEALEEEVREVRIGQLAKLTKALKKLEDAQKADKEVDKEAAAAAPAAAAPTVEAVRERMSALVRSLEAECKAASAHEQQLSLAGAVLTSEETLCSRTDAAALSGLVKLATETAALVDQTALAAAFGTSTDPDDKAQVKQRKKDEVKKKALVSALRTKALALTDLHAVTPGAETLTALDGAVAELHKWAAPADDIKVTCRWHKLHGRGATALNALNDSLSKLKAPPSKENLELKIELLDALGWTHWAANLRALLLVKFPAAFPLVFSRL